MDDRDRELPDSPRHGDYGHVCHERCEVWIDPERIVVAAIRQDWVVFTAPHHHQIFRYVAAMHGTPLRGGMQGFITSRGRFVDRGEAARIAIAAGQVERVGEGDSLFSEQLWEVTDYAFAGLPAPATDRDRELEGLAEKIAEALERSGALQDPPPLDGSGKEQREQGLTHVVALLRSAWAEREKAHACSPQWGPRGMVDSAPCSTCGRTLDLGLWAEAEARLVEKAERAAKVSAVDLAAAREELAEARALLGSLRVDCLPEHDRVRISAMYARLASSSLAAQPTQEGQPPAVSDSCGAVGPNPNHRCVLMAWHPGAHSGDGWVWSNDPERAPEGQPGEREIVMPEGRCTEHRVWHCRWCKEAQEGQPLCDEGYESGGPQGWIGCAQPLPCPDHPPEAPEGQPPAKWNIRHPWTPHAFVTHPTYPAEGIGLCQSHILAGPMPALCARPSTDKIHNGFRPGVPSDPLGERPSLGGEMLGRKASEGQLERHDFMSHPVDDRQCIYSASGDINDGICGKPASDPAHTPAEPGERCSGVDDHAPGDCTPPKWRVGSKVGKTIYKGHGPDDLIGVMFTREDATRAVAAVNGAQGETRETRFIDKSLERDPARHAFVECYGKRPPSHRCFNDTCHATGCGKPASDPVHLCTYDDCFHKRPAPPGTSPDPGHEDAALAEGGVQTGDVLCGGCGDRYFGESDEWRHGFGKCVPALIREDDDRD